MVRKLYLKPATTVVALQQECPILARAASGAASIVDIQTPHNCVKDAGEDQYSQKKQSHPIWGNMEP